jgi:hypothetical protein
MPNLFMPGRVTTSSTNSNTFQYRDDRRQHIKQVVGKRRWVNKGLGQTYGEINTNCQKLATDSLKQNVAARTLVISPELSFMQALPEHRRIPVLAELTEMTVERWFDAMALPTAEHSYVIHRGLSKAERPDGLTKDVAAGQEFLHSHVVLAATVPGFEADREKYWVGKRQLPMLHEAAREAMEHIWTRELGAERVQELNTELTAKTQHLQELDAARQQQAVQRETPDNQTVTKALDEIYEKLGMKIPDSPPKPDGKPFAIQPELADDFDLEP